MQSKNKLKLVIFDMDGLMLDTEIIHFKTWMVYSKEYGFEYNLEKRLKFTGMSDETVIDKLAEEMGNYDDAVEMRSKILEARRDYFSNTDKSLLKEGLLELLDYLDDNNVKKVIASSSGRERLDFLLSKENILSRFDDIVTKEDVENSKPDPEIFLLAYNRNNYEKDECLILEDSENGYLAAKRSGIPYMIVPDSSFEFHNLSADVTYRDLYEVKEYIDEKYFKEH